MIETTAILSLLTWLTTKHLIVDFNLQTKYQWSNKGTFGHPAGLLHAGLHALATFIVCSIWAGTHEGVTATITYIATIASIEFVVHYIIDYLKMNQNAKLKLTPEDPEFWYLLGFDQYLHMMTYIIIVRTLV